MSDIIDNKINLENNCKNEKEDCNNSKEKYKNITYNLNPHAEKNL